MKKVYINIKNKKRVQSAVSAGNESVW